MIHVGTSEAIALLTQLGVDPTTERITAVLAWERLHNERVRKHADHLAWLVEQHQTMLDMLMGDSANAARLPSGSLKKPPLKG